MENKIIVLRSVYGKVKECHLQPCKQPNGMNFPFVKAVRYDVNGNAEMIMSDKERNSVDSQYFVPEDEIITITDGTTFDLSNPKEKNRWLAIKDSFLIAPSRDAKDGKGISLIDGDKTRYGLAEFYIDIPGEESAKSVSKKKLITNPKHYILETVHPSPLSAYNGFFGCKHFSKTNEILQSMGSTPIDWSLD